MMLSDKTVCLLASVKQKDARVPFTALSSNAANFFARADFAGAMVPVMRRGLLEEHWKFRPGKNAP